MYRYILISVAFLCLIAFLASSQLSDSNEIILPHIMNEVPLDVFASVNLSSEEINKTIDFGFKGIGMIGDLLWVDEIRNGVQDENMSKSGITGVEIELYKFYGGTWVLISNNTTSQDGSYLFEDLFDGEYRLKVKDIRMSKKIDGNYSWALTTPHNCSHPENNCIDPENNDSNHPDDIVNIDESNFINMTIDFGYINAD